MDSFDHYNTIDEMVAKWTWAQFATIVPGRNGQGVLLQGGPGVISKSLKHESTWIVGWACYFQTTAFLGTSNIYILSNTGQALALIQLNTDGSINLASAGPGGGIMGTTAEGVPPFYCRPNRWYFFEAKIQIFGGGDVSIAASLRIDGDLRIALCTGNTGLNSDNFVVPGGTANFHQFVGGPNSPGMIIDDVRFLDTSGAFNNTFLDDLAIFCVFPRADVLTQWTGLVSGDQFSQINNITPLGDASYVFASEPPNSPPQSIDNFLWQPIPAFFGDLFAIQMSIYARKDAEGVRAVQSFSGAMRSDIFYLDDNYIYYTFPMDSNEGVKWTILAFNAKSYGFQLMV